MSKPALVVTLTAEGKRNLKLTLEKLSSVATDELGLPPERVRMGGPPVDNVAISVEGEKTLIRLFIPAGIVGLSLAFWCLRSVRLTTMVFSGTLICRRWRETWRSFIIPARR